MSLSGQVALVTGAARGIGKGYAEALLQRKAKVVIVDVLEEVGQATCKELNNSYGEGSVQFICGDLRQNETIDKAFGAVKATPAKFGLVINNAAIGGLGLDPDLAYGINTIASSKISERAIEMMRKSEGGDGGVIINIGSISGLILLPDAGVYQGTKFGVVAYTYATAKSLGEEEGIRMHSLNPTFVRTDMVTYFATEYDKGNPDVIQIVNDCGGWVAKEKVVATMMQMIERRDLPQGSIIKISSEGATFVEKYITETPTGW